MTPLPPNTTNLPLHQTELVKKLEVSVRTIYRDIEALNEAGIPIYAETGRGGGIHLMSDFVLEKA